MQLPLVLFNTQTLDLMPDIICDCDVTLTPDKYVATGTVMIRKGRKGLFTRADVCFLPDAASVLL